MDVRNEVSLSLKISLLIFAILLLATLLVAVKRSVGEAFEEDYLIKSPPLLDSADK